MKITAGTVVTIAYDLCTKSGEIVESSDISGSISFLQGSKVVIPGLDARLEGLEQGAEQNFEFSAEEAFGNVEDAPVKEVGRSEFPSGAVLKSGESFEAGVGEGQTVLLKIVAVKEETVSLRMLHPLAGQVISMSVHVLGVRAATNKEKQAGKVLLSPPPPPPPPPR